MGNEQKEGKIVVDALYIYPLDDSHRTYSVFLLRSFSIRYDQFIQIIMMLPNRDPLGSSCR